MQMTNGITSRLISEMKKFYYQETSLPGSIKRNVQIKALLNTSKELSEQQKWEGELCCLLSFRFNKGLAKREIRLLQSL